MLAPVSEPPSPEPESLQAALLSALRLHGAGDHATALQTLERLSDLHPTDYRVWWALANVAEQPEAVVSALHATLSLNPDLHEAREKLDKLNRRSSRRRH